MPPDGCARIVSDCIVEKWERASGVVVTNQPADRDDELVLQVTSPTGSTTLCPVRVASCVPDSRHGPMRFRLQVQLITTASTPIWGGLKSSPRIPQGTD
jgi:hypothetical protein